MRGKWGRKLKGFYAKYLVMHKKSLILYRILIPTLLHFVTTSLRLHYDFVTSSLRNCPKNKDSSKSRGVC